MTAVVRPESSVLMSAAVNLGSTSFWHASNLLDTAIVIIIPSVCLSVCHTCEPRFEILKYGLHHDTLIREDYCGTKYETMVP